MTNSLLSLLLLLLCLVIQLGQGEDGHTMLGGTSNSLGDVPGTLHPLSTCPGMVALEYMVK